jgi:hypothetical protein
MALAAALPGRAVSGPRISAETLRLGLLWLMGFANALVFLEPSPYEIIGVLAFILFATLGLTIRTALTPLIALLILINVGYLLSVAQVGDQIKSVIWVFISAFLALTAVFYAAALGANTERRLDLLMGGYIAAAIVSSIAGIGGYFHAFGGLSDLFLLYGRARGTFNDPNVLGAFLLLPGLVLLGRLLGGHGIMRNGPMFLVLLGALFLSFSRAAWGCMAACSCILMALTFLTSQSPRERIRLIVIAVVGVLAVALFVLALLSIDKVAQLFTERAALEQSYDVGRFGRFGRWMLGADMALVAPFGIGPLQFWHIFYPEDPHNSLLNAFMSGGWFAGIGYFTLSILTAVTGARFILVRTPWQPIYHAVYAAYLGVIGESAIVDIDHWRHYYLILGVLWGLMLASRAYKPPRPAGRFAGQAVPG